jgi:hypothetical protein
VLITASVQVPIFMYLAKDTDDGQPERRPAPTPQGHETASTGSLETGSRLVAQPDLNATGSLATERPPSTQPQAANARGQVPPKPTYNCKTVPLPASMSPFFELEEGGMCYKCLPCTHVQKADVFINARQQGAILSHIGLENRDKSKPDIADPDAYGAEQPSTRPTVQCRTLAQHLEDALRTGLIAKGDHFANVIQYEKHIAAMAAAD